MVRRDLSVFVLKLSDLKEYEQAKQDRLAAKMNDSGVADSTSSSSNSKGPLATKVGPKSKQEVHDRIGMK